MKKFILATAILANVSAPGFCLSSNAGADESGQGDAGFAEDLAQVRKLARRKASAWAIEPRLADKSVAQAVEHHMRYAKFVKEKMAPHARAMMAGRNDPPALLDAGLKKLAAEANSWEGYDYVATAKLMQKDSKGAIESYGKALENSPEEVRGWYQYMLGVSFLMEKDQEKALLWLDKAIADNNNWAAVKSAHLNKAAVCLAGNMREKAAESLNTYFEMARSNEARMVAAGPICKMTISAGLKVAGCGNNQ